jgi:hypothetical protein
MASLVAQRLMLQSMRTAGTVARSAARYASTNGGIKAGVPTAASGTAHVMIADPRTLLTESVNTRDYILADVSTSVLTALKRGEVAETLSEIDEPGNAWWAPGQVADADITTFEYEGAVPTSSGYVAVLERAKGGGNARPVVPAGGGAAAWEAMKDRLEAAAAAATAGKPDTHVKLTGAAAAPFLFVGRVLQAPIAGVYVRKDALALVAESSGSED